MFTKTHSYPLIDCYSYADGETEWQDISAGRKFKSLATNPENHSAWAVLDQEHSSGKGYQIAKYDTGNGIWRAGPTQPKGVLLHALAIDSKAQPAIVQSTSPRHIFYK